MQNKTQTFQSFNLIPDLMHKHTDAPASINVVKKGLARIAYFCNQYRFNSYKRMSSLQTIPE